MAYVSRRRVYLPRMVEIPPDHIFSRLCPFPHPIRIGNLECTSIEQVLAACKLAQHNMYEEAISFWPSRRHIDPTQVGNAVDGHFQHRNVVVKAAWPLNVLDTMRTVLIDVIDHYPAMRDELQKLWNEFGHGLYFVEVTNNRNERVFSCGHRSGHVPQDQDTWCGENLYGEAMTTVYKYRIGGVGTRLQESPPVPILLTRSVLPTNAFQRTAVIISDSMCRHVKSVEGGDIWINTGYTLGELARAIFQKHGNVMDFKYVLIFASTNDSNKSDDDRLVSWTVFRRLVDILVNHPYIRLVFHTGVGVKRWPEVPEYTHWLRTMWDEAYGEAENFLLMDWSEPGDGNFLMYHNREPNPDYMHNDGKHPNEKGIRRMYRETIKTFTAVEGLRGLRFITTADKYPVRQLKDRVSLVE